MLACEWRPRAQVDRESIAIYLGQEMGNPQAALQAIRAIDAALAFVCEFPFAGHPIIDDMLEADGYRWWQAGRYKIVYTATDAVLTVWRVYHERQDIADYAAVSVEGR